ncbi:MAG: flagellar biosynthetic protein FliP, partial [Methylococcales bacterium]|nr:flagellar biosynthetic protein FliP [Methylococcales bacterium]
MPAGIEALTVTGDAKSGQTYSVTLQILVLMTLLTLLPAMLLTMTAFTRIMIVFSLLRQALGTGQVPSNQVLLGLSLFLTIFIMMPVFEKVNVEAVQPYMEEKIDA